MNVTNVDEFSLAAYGSELSDPPATNLLAGLLQYATFSNLNPIVDHVWVSNQIGDFPSLNRGYYLPKYSRMPSGASKKLVELMSLGNGWDGGVAPPISEKTIETAGNIITWLNGAFSHFDVPHIVPTFEGLLQIEWHNARRSLEFEFTPEGLSLLGVDLANIDDPKYYTKVLSDIQIPDLEPFYSWFANSDLVWPS